MTKRAENEIRKRIEAAGEPSMIEQLCLDSIEIKNFTPNIKKMLESCTNLEYLTLNDCAMKSLEHFPNLKSLIVLELSDNKYLSFHSDSLAKT
jgi:Leucine-rich repeat (LRR) protein